MNEVNSSPATIRLYRTSDLYFAAFLCSLDFQLKTTETSNTPDGGKKVVFVFALPDQDLARTKAMYFGGTGTVKARVFVDHLRSLKQICYC
jgi:hypothetical protein